MNDKNTPITLEIMSLRSLVPGYKRYIEHIAANKEDSDWDDWLKEIFAIDVDF